MPTNSVVLQGSGADVDGTIKSYAWSQVSGPGTAVLSGASTSALTASSLAEGSYVFALTVTDNQDAVSTPDQVTVTVNPAPAVTYTLTTTASPGAGGTVGRSPNATSYASGSVVSLTATPAAGYVFSGWSGDATGTTNPLSVTMSANKSITATFTQMPPTTFTLTTTASPTVGGSISRTPNATSYASGTVVSLTATPAAGYTFTGWSGDATGTVNPLSVTMSANKSITATFTATGGGAQM
ncbi:InlB B-repeat-containing protein [Hymenobacter sp. HDW8]|uniref:InlB B-repeat-containing protein n=1 Tax=Hymenobacter sp. HDW8 TaxID=2714932 RepID=UPI00196AA9B5|nr:InlB B-repeat-containing protein [Hymenobacter sp. HDW8]